MSRIALITGASRGIGRSIALRLARDGYHVALNDLPLQRPRLTDLQQEISKNGQQAAICVGDVSKEGDVERLVQDVTHQFGGLDVVRPAELCPAILLIALHPDGCKRGYLHHETYR